MRTLIYVPNRQQNVAKELELKGSFVHPPHFDGPEPNVQNVIILDICPNWQLIRDVYEDQGTPVEVIEVAAALEAARTPPKIAAVPEPAPRAERTRKELFAAARSLGLRVAGNIKTDNLRKRVRAAEAKGA